MIIYSVVDGTDGRIAIVSGTDEKGSLVDGILESEDVLFGSTVGEMDPGAYDSDGNKVKGVPDDEEDLAKAGSGVMLGFWIPKDVASKLAQDGGEKPEEMHITVAYLGKADAYDKEDFERIRNVAAKICSEQPKLTGTINGIGKFNATESSDDKDVIHAIVDVPYLESFREKLIKALKAEGYDVKRNHGYSPHITLAYVDKGSDAALPKVGDIPIEFGALTLAVAGDHKKLPLAKRELTKEYLDSVLERIKSHLPEWLYKQIHRMAMASAGGKTRWRLAREKQNDLESEPIGKASSEELFHGEITKVDEDRHLVFGWASISEEGGKALVDRQGDVISEDDLEKMAYEFVLTSRKAGEMHEKVGVGKLVESMAFTKEKQKILGIDLGKVGHWVGFKITDADVWKKVKSGEYKAFSIHGRGVRAKL